MSLESLREVSDYRFYEGNVQNRCGISCWTRNQGSFQKLLRNSQIKGAKRLKLPWAKCRKVREAIRVITAINWNTVIFFLHITLLHYYIIHMYNITTHECILFLVIFKNYTGHSRRKLKHQIIILKRVRKENNLAFKKKSNNQKTP